MKLFAHKNMMMCVGVNRAHCAHGEIFTYYRAWLACHRKKLFKPNDLDFLALYQIFISMEISYSTVLH